MELTNIHPAEAYLRNEQNPSFLYIKNMYLKPSHNGFNLFFVWLIIVFLEYD